MLCSYVYFPAPNPEPLLWNFSPSGCLSLACFGKSSGPGFRDGVIISLAGLWVRQTIWSSWEFRHCLWGIYPLLPLEHSGLDCCCCSRKRKGKGFRDSPVSKALAHNGPSLIPRTRKAGWVRCGGTLEWQRQVDLCVLGQPGLQRSSRPSRAVLSSTPPPLSFS